MKSIYVALVVSLVSMSAHAEYKRDPKALEEENRKMQESNQQIFDDEQDSLSNIDHIIQTVCDSDAQILVQEKALKRQKEISKVAGTTNLTATHDAATRLVDLKEARQDALERYKTKMGKDLNEYSCE